MQISKIHYLEEYFFQLLGELEKKILKSCDKENKQGEQETVLFLSCPMLSLHPNTPDSPFLASPINNYCFSRHSEGLQFKTYNFRYFKDKYREKIPLSRATCA